MEQRVFGPERKIDPKDQPRGTWREEQAAAYLGMRVGTLRNWRFKCVGCESACNIDPLFRVIGTET